MVTALVPSPAPRVGFRCGVELCGISSLKIPWLRCRSGAICISRAAGNKHFPQVMVCQWLAGVGPVAGTKGEPVGPVPQSLLELEAESTAAAAAGARWGFGEQTDRVSQCCGVFPLPALLGMRLCLVGVCSHRALELSWAVQELHLFRKVLQTYAEWGLLWYGR